MQVGPRPPPSPLATGSTRKVALLRLDHLPSVPGYRGEDKPEGPRAPLAHRASKGPPVGTQGRTPGSPPPCAARTSRHEPAQTDGPLGVRAPELRASAKAGDPLGQAPSWPRGSRVSKPRPHCPLHPRGNLNWAPGGPRESSAAAVSPEPPHTWDRGGEVPLPSPFTPPPCPLGPSRCGSRTAGPSTPACRDRPKGEVGEPARPGAAEPASPNVSLPLPPSLFPPMSLSTPRSGSLSLLAPRSLGAQAPVTPLRTVPGGSPPRQSLAPAAGAPPRGPGRAPRGPSRLHQPRPRPWLPPPPGFRAAPSQTSGQTPAAC